MRNPARACKYDTRTRNIIVEASAKVDKAAVVAERITPHFSRMWGNSINVRSLIIMPFSVE